MASGCLQRIEIAEVLKIGLVTVIFREPQVARCSGKIKGATYTVHIFCLVYFMVLIPLVKLTAVWMDDLHLPIRSMSQ